MPKQLGCRSDRGDNVSQDRRILHEGFFRLEVIDTIDGPREVLRVGCSACVLLFEPSARRLILVRQPRATMIAEGNPEGHITELVAGLMDDGLEPRALMAKEAREEAGVNVPPERIELLNGGHPMAVAAGATDELTYLGFAEIAADEIEPGEHIRGAAGENERIQRVYISLDDVPTHICEDIRSFALLLHLRLKLQAAEGR